MLRTSQQRLNHWTFADNVFKNIKGANGGGRGAIFVWNQSRNVVVERNLFTVAHDVPQHEADLVFASWAHGGGNGGYIGLLDDIAIFNVALYEADVKDIMQNGLGEFGSPIEPKGKLAARWGKIKSSAWFTK